MNTFYFIFQKDFTKGPMLQNGSKFVRKLTAKISNKKYHSIIAVRLSTKTQQLRKTEFHSHEN